MNTNHAFQPETVEALAMAFYKAWRFLSKDPRFARENRALLQQRLSGCLMQLATDGEDDALRLANCAIRRMREQCSSNFESFGQQRNADSL